MARAYIEEIRSVQPNGPYFLGGFSGGGLTAYEIAQQLKASGDEVGCLVLLDTPLPFGPPALSASDRAQIQIQQLQRKGAGYIGEWAVKRWNWEVQKLRKRFDDAEPDRAPDEFHDEAIEQAFRRALKRYRLEKWDGKISLIRPKLQVAYDLGNGRLLNEDRDYIYPDNGWGDWVAELEVHEVPGDHDSMVLEPNVRVLVGRMRQAIEEAEAVLRQRRGTELRAAE